MEDILIKSFINTKYMKTIKFIWSGVEHVGTVTRQEPSPIQGQVTVVDVHTPFKTQFTLYGKVAVGNCGPFTVVSIT